MSGRLIDVWEEVWPRVWVPFLRELENDSEPILGSIIEICFNHPKLPKEPTPSDDVSRDANGFITDTNFLKELEAYKQRLETHKNEVSRYLNATSGCSSAIWLKEKIEKFSSEKECVTLMSDAASFLIEEYSIGAGPIFVKNVNLFIDRFGLGYTVVPQGTLVLNQLGMFANILRTNHEAAKKDDYLLARLHEFEEALADLTFNRPHSPGRMKTLIGKSIVLLEAFGVQNSELDGTTISEMLKKLDLPHATLSKLIDTLYAFRGDFPGMAHGGNPRGMKRELKMIDTIVITVLITSITPYFLQKFDSESCFRNDLKMI